MTRSKKLTAALAAIIALSFCAGVTTTLMVLDSWSTVGEQVHFEP